MIINCEWSLDSSPYIIPRNDSAPLDESKKADTPPTDTKDIKEEKD